MNARGIRIFIKKKYFFFTFFGFFSQNNKDFYSFARRMAGKWKEWKWSECNKHHQTSCIACLYRVEENEKFLFSLLLFFAFVLFFLTIPKREIKQQKREKKNLTRNNEICKTNRTHTKRIQRKTIADAGGKRNRGKTVDIF